MKKLFMLCVAFPLLVSARYSDQCHEKIVAIRELYRKRSELIKEKTKQEPESIKKTIMLKNLAKAQDAERYEANLAKYDDKCFVGRALCCAPAKPKDYDISTHCWDKLGDLRYEEIVVNDQPKA